MTKCTPLRPTTRTNTDKDRSGKMFVIWRDPYGGHRKPPGLAAWPPGAGLDRQRTESARYLTEGPHRAGGAVQAQSLRIVGSRSLIHAHSARLDESRPAGRVPLVCQRKEL